MKQIFLMAMVLVAIQGAGDLCSSRSLALPGGSEGRWNDDFDVEIRVNRRYGVIPFEVTFTLETTQGSDIIEQAYWDFESDGIFDASGITSFNTFTEAIDYEVSVDIVTGSHGTLTKTTTISGHNALMTLTFDDGHESAYTQALPILESKGVTATAYIVPIWIGHVWYMAWFQVDALQDAGWDIGSHSMSHAKLTEVDDSTLHYELAQSKYELQVRGFPAKHFAVPYGSYNDRVIDAIKLYYDSNRIGDGLNGRVEESDPYLLHCYASLSWKAFGYYQAHIDSAIATRGWYILNNHKVSSNCDDVTWCIHPQMLSDIIDYALQNRVKIVNIDQALEDGLGDMAGLQVDTFPQADPPIEIGFVAAYLTSSRPEAAITYRLRRPSPVKISIHNPLGRLVRTLLTGQQSTGDHSLTWNGLDEYGRPVASGVYFCAFEAGQDFSGSRRIVVLR